MSGRLERVAFVSCEFEPVHDAIDVLAPTAAVARRSLPGRTEAELSQHLARSGIVDEVASRDPIVAKQLCYFQRTAGGFGCIALPPERTSDPVAELDMVAARIETDTPACRWP